MLRGWRSKTAKPSKLSISLSILLRAGWLRLICWAARCMLRVRPRVSMSTRCLNLSQLQKVENDRSDMVLPGGMNGIFQ
ncbi:hypothetical protein D9M68_890600 [compost metagenome]